MRRPRVDGVPLRHAALRSSAAPTRSRSSRIADERARSCRALVGIAVVAGDPVPLDAAARRRRAAPARRPRSPCPSSRRSADGRQRHPLPLLLGAHDWGALPRGPSVGGDARATLWPPSGAAARRGHGWDRDRQELTPGPSRVGASDAGRRAGRSSRRRGAAPRSTATATGTGSTPTATGDPACTSAGTGATTPRSGRPAHGAAPRAARRASRRRAAARRRSRRAGSRGLAVTEDHYLVVGHARPRRAARVRPARGRPAAAAWRGRRACRSRRSTWRRAPGGGVFVLDRDRADAARVWRLDRQLRGRAARPGREPAVHAARRRSRPADGDAAPVAPRRPATARDPRLGRRAARRRRRSRSTSPARDRVVRPRPTGRRAAARASGCSTPASASGRLAATSLAGLDRRFARARHGRRRRRRPPATGPSGARADALRRRRARRPGATRSPSTDGAGHAAALADDYFPMRLFGGTGLVGDAAGGLLRLRRPLGAARRAAPAALRGRGPRSSRRCFDGGEPGLRLAPAAARRAASRRETAVARREPRAPTTAADLDGPRRGAPSRRPYRRGDGSELPFPWTPHGGAVRDVRAALPARARAATCRLRLGSRATGATTPRLRALRAYYPRFSYLEHYLPAVYREDAASASLPRPLPGQPRGHLHGDRGPRSRRRRCCSTRGPRRARRSTGWPAWFDVALDPSWDEDRRRLFLRHAATFFRLPRHRARAALALRLALDRAARTSRCSRPTATRSRGGIRIVERFRTMRRARRPCSATRRARSRRARSPAAVAGRPADGGAALHERWAAFVGAAGGARTRRSPRPRGPATPSARRPDRWPARGARSRRPCSGFVPPATPDDTTRWQRFLARRYRTVEALNAAHRRLGAAHVARRSTQVALPDALPADGAAAGRLVRRSRRVVLPSAARRTASPCCCPCRSGARPRRRRPRRGRRERRAIQDRVARLVDLEKPAHTIFDVQLYWVAFRVGEARLGKDTLLDLGSRSPDLRPPAVLGRARSAKASHLGWPMSRSGRPSSRGRSTRPPGASRGGPMDSTIAASACPTCAPATRPSTSTTRSGWSSASTTSTRSSPTSRRATAGWRATSSATAPSGACRSGTSRTRSTRSPRAVTVDRGVAVTPCGELVCVAGGAVRVPRPWLRRTRDELDRCDPGRRRPPVRLRRALLPRRRDRRRADPRRAVPDRGRADGAVAARGRLPARAAARAAAAARGGRDPRRRRLAASRALPRRRGFHVPRPPGGDARGGRPGPSRVSSRGAGGGGAGGRGASQARVAGTTPLPRNRRSSRTRNPRTRNPAPRPAARPRENRAPRPRPTRPAAPVLVAKPEEDGADAEAPWGTWMRTPPPESLRFPCDDATAWFREAFRIWITELRPRWRLDVGCGSECEPEDAGRAVLLGRAVIPVDREETGWVLTGEVELDEIRRPAAPPPADAPGVRPVRRLLRLRRGRACASTRRQGRATRVPRVTRGPRRQGARR